MLVWAGVYPTEVVQEVKAVPLWVNKRARDQTVVLQPNAAACFKPTLVWITHSDTNCYLGECLYC